MMPPPPPPPPPPPHDPHILEANGRYHTKPESPTLIVFLNVINTLTQLLLGAVAFSAISFASVYGFSSAFTQHICLCVIGYVILMSQAILSFDNRVGWTYSLKYPQKKIIHWVMQITGSIFAIVGSVVKIIHTEQNFGTAHGILGVIAMLLTILSLIGGVVNLMLPVLMNSLLFKTLHGCLGTLTITVAYLTLCLGFTDWYRYVFGDTNANLSIALTIFALGGILFSSLFRIFKRIAA